MEQESLKFAAAVKRMRERQIEYFATRDSKTLRRAKDAERAVDARLAAMELPAPAEQQALFDLGQKPPWEED